jgi:hypothetical protein
MKEKGVSIYYGAIAPNAKENFIASSSEKESFVDLSEFNQSGLVYGNYKNPCELNSFVLDGSCEVVPKDTSSVDLGLWSVQISQEDGYFPSPVVVEFNANSFYSSQGITLTFDEDGFVFAKSLKIGWYNNESLIAEEYFSPDSPRFLCIKDVSNYNRLVITFYSINMPFTRLRFHSIEYGYGRTFSGGELQNVSLIQEIDPISSEIAINTCDFTINSQQDIELIFQEKQPLSVYFDGKLIASTFINDSTRKSKNVYTVQSEDYIGVLEDIPFHGGIYKKANAADLLEEIFTTAKVPYFIEDSFASDVVSGYIPYTNCREALMQVAFAISAVVDTSNSNVVNVYSVSNNPTQEIGLNRIKEGQSFGKKNTITSVELTSHSYKETQEEVELFNSDDAGTGENIFLIFAEPIHSLSIINGEIVSRGTNYAVINANVGCVLTGKKYDHKTVVRRKNNPFVAPTEIQNVVSIQDATLISGGNVDYVLEKCYNYIANTNSINLQIIEGKHEISHESVYGSYKYGESMYGYAEETYRDDPVSVGDMITTQTAYLGDITGRVIKQTFNLNGGIIVKNTVMKYSQR